MAVDGTDGCVLKLMKTITQMYLTGLNRTDVLVNQYIDAGMDIIAMKTDFIAVAGILAKMKIIKYKKYNNLVVGYYNEFKRKNT